jgi:hypothetical protein
MDEVEERAKLAAQSILENESLSDGLEDAPAAVLLDWGVAGAKAAASASAGMDAAEADEWMDDRMRALRRMLKGASRWLQARIEGDDETAADQLATALEHAAAVYGEAFQPPDPAHAAALDLAADPAAALAALRALFEPAASTPDTHAAPEEPPTQQTAGEDSHHPSQNWDEWDHHDDENNDKETL